MELIDLSGMDYDTDVEQWAEPQAAEPQAAEPDVLGAAAPAHPEMLGVRLSPKGFERYLDTYQFGPIEPDRIVLHHTVIPDEGQWSGLASMLAMQRFYAGKGWRAAPHIYGAPDGIWLFSPMNRPGIHAGLGNCNVEYQSPVWGAGQLKWYSIGWEMVGNFDKRLPAGPVWEHTRAGLLALLRRLRLSPSAISFHRDYTNAKSCPGWSVTKPWVTAQLSEALKASRRYDELSLLLGSPGAGSERVMAYIIKRGTDPSYPPGDVRKIVERYWDVCLPAGVDPVLAVAQMLHETANLRSFWSLRPRRNPAGIGVTGVSLPGEPEQPPGEHWAWKESERRWQAGVSFPTWEQDAIPAHVGRLLAYALEPGSANAYQAELIRVATEWRPFPAIGRGTAPNLKQLGKAHNPRGADGIGWASPGRAYGAAIAALANKMIADPR